MKIDKLSETQLEIIKSCLIVSSDERVFPDWEFETLFGISREVSSQWPNVDFKSPDVGMAVLSSLNHLLGYSNMNDEEWRQNFSFAPEEALKLLGDIA